LVPHPPSLQICAGFVDFHSDFYSGTLTELPRGVRGIFRASRGWTIQVPPETRAVSPGFVIAAAMVIRLIPKASRPFPAAWPRAGTYHERPGAGWRDLWRHVQAKLPG
jgi:hypothetical protein